MNIDSSMFSLAKGKKGNISDKKTGGRKKAPSVTLLPSISLPTSLPPNAPRAKHLAIMLRQSMDGTFIDTKFYLFSRRNNQGEAYKPVAIFANSYMLKQQSAYFEGLLSDASGFAEDLIQALDAEYPQHRPSKTIEYDYEDDSDLEDDDGCIDLNLFERAQDASGEELELKNLKTDNLSPPLESDICIISDEPTKQPQLTDMVRKGRVIFIQHEASKTWQSLVYYLYTGEVSFAPLKSQGVEAMKTALAEHRKGYPERPPLCSPKSLYRLADKMHLDELKTLTLNDIRSKLSKENILVELFSVFTSWFPQILDMEIDVLCSSSMHRQVVVAIPQLMNKVVGGQLPFSGAIVSALYMKFSQHNRF